MGARFSTSAQPSGSRATKPSSSATLMVIPGRPTAVEFREGIGLAAPRGRGRSRFARSPRDTTVTLGAGGAGIVHRARGRRRATLLRGGGGRQ